MLATFTKDVIHYRIPLMIVGGAVAAVLLILLGRRLLLRLPAGTPWFYYLASIGGLAVSLNTSWRFFGERLAITGAERFIMFSVVELALIACALGMRANVRRIDPLSGKPGPAGPPRLVAWALCGLSAYAALLLSGPIDGVARVALGPVLSLVMLHLALGIEIRNRTTGRTGTWARISGEMRERLLSRLGLADDDRDAVTRTRERAASRAARLVLTPGAPRRSARLTRALRAAQIAHDPRMRERMLAELAVLRSADELANLTQPSPWAEIAAETETVEIETDTVVVPSVAMGDNVTLRVAQPLLNPPASDDTMVGGELDGVILTADADDTGRLWETEVSKNAAIDRADILLPGRTPRQLVVALSAVGVTVAESTIRRRRSTRVPADATDGTARSAKRSPRPRSAVR